jgi:hypothetical protein
MCPRFTILNGMNYWLEINPAARFANQCNASFPVGIDCGGNPAAFRRVSLNGYELTE